MGMIKSIDRHWPIWLWVILLAVVAGWSVLNTLYHRLAAQKEAARLIVQHELLAHHWKKLEADKEFRRVIDALASEARSEVTGMEWSARFIGTSATGATAPDPFETKALKMIEGGTDEVWEQSWRGVSRYVRAIRGNALCLSCHPTKTNGLIGSISIEFGSATDHPNASVALNSGVP